MSDILQDLNKRQREAVAHKNGPCLIIAGAGTGKTKVITTKIAYIIAQKWAKPSEILALTFTDKAAQEMEERVDVLVPYGFVDTWISTFHAFGDRILRDHSIDIGLPANFKILSSTQQAIFVRENLYEFELDHFRPLADPTSYIRELLSHFSRLKDELIDPEAYLIYAKKKLESSKKANDEVAYEEAMNISEIAKAYKKYQDLMLKDGNLDYGDQIYLTYQLLSKRKNILKNLQTRFKYILLDEFQDTNFAQYQIVKLLSGNKNITVVGDDDQSIYRFRGASISNILSFKSDFPNCKQIVLNKNYRSTKQILDCSYKLIQHNNPDRLELQNKIDKRLESERNGESPTLLHCESLSCETDLVVEKIKDLKKKFKYKNSDFAILARANNHLEPFLKALDKSRIPSIYIGSSSLFQKEEVRSLISFLKCLAYKDDNISFYQLAVSDIYNVDPNILASYYSKVKKGNKSYEEIFQGEESDIKTSTILTDLSRYRKLIALKSTGEIIYQFLKETGYLKKLSSAESLDSENKITNIAKFFEKIAQFDQVSPNRSALSFLENLELITEVGEEQTALDFDADIDAVNVMSVHASKGLEWPVVFIVNMVSDRFPSKERKEKIPIPNELIKEKLPSGDFHLQEERRLFYVGCTRAMNQLFFTSADDYGGKRYKKISQFILESLDNSQLIKQRHKQSAIEKIARHAPPLKENAAIQRTAAINSDQILRISRQQIDDYYTCPKKYYFSSVIKIPLPTNWHFMYGTAIHEAISRYYLRKLSGSATTLEQLIDDFDQSFISEGFITREHEEQRKSKGIDTLTQFFQEDQQINLAPFKIEDSFEFCEDNVKINGRYDLVIKNGQDYKICDFKTSEVKNQKDADSRIKKSTQMMIYALAWREKFSAIPTTSLIFIESGIKAEYKFKDKDLEKTKEMIQVVAQGVRNSNFKAKPDLRQCGLCPYKDICRDARI